MWLDSGVMTTLISAVHRFRILVVGKASLWSTQPRSGQTDAALNHREALGNPRSLMPLLEWI